VPFSSLFVFFISFKVMKYSMKTKKEIFKNYTVNKVNYIEKYNIYMRILNLVEFE